MTPSTLHLVLAALTLSTLAAPADADLITTSMDTSTPIMTFVIPAAGINGESGYVGPNTIVFDGTSTSQAYCTDLFRSIGVNDSYAAKFAPLSDLSNHSLVSRLFAADSALGDVSSLEKAALQLAVWDVIETGRAGLGGFTDPFAFPSQRTDRGSDHVNVYGDDAHTQLLFGLSSSSLVLDAADGSGVLDRMDDLISQAGRLAVGADLFYIQPTTGYGQGFVGLRSVPEPPSLILSIVGLTGAIGLELRRRCRRPD